MKHRIAWLRLRSIDRHSPESLGVRLRRDGAFTLIEVTVGIVILATGLTILLGLQSSSIRRAIHDRNEQFAMLLSRAILAGVEAGITDAVEGERQGPASEFTKELQMFNDAAETDLKQLQQFEVDWNVVATDLPVKEKALKRVQLTIRWGKDPADAFSVVSFFPGEPEAAPDDPT